MTGIGKRIKSRRESIGMTQEELASMLGYRNKSSIAKIETGVNDIVQSKVKEFAEALNTSVSYLMGWTVNKENTNCAKIPALPNDEEELLGNYRLLPPPEKAGARAYMSTLAEQYKNVGLDNDFIYGEAAAYGGDSQKIKTTKENLKKFHQMKERFDD